MHIIWEFTERDFDCIKSFVSQESTTAFYKQRFQKNIERKNIILTKDYILNRMMMVLLTTLQKSGPDYDVSKFLRLNPFPITYESVSAHGDHIFQFIQDCLQNHGLKRFHKKISKNFQRNFMILEKENWQLLNTLKGEFEKKLSISDERSLADDLHKKYFGFGPKQARNFLQSVGLAKYEIPIDSRMRKRFAMLGFPDFIYSIALQDKDYYHWVSNIIQDLCSKCDIIPCLLDAAIFASFDSNKWDDANTVY